MKKLISILLHLIVLFVLPLVFKLEVLLYPQVILSAFVILLLLLTQPPMKIKEVSRDKKTDKGSIMLILYCSVLGHIGSISEWAYFPQLNIPVLTYIGASFMIFGISFRIVAIKILKKAFSSTLQIKDGQRLITKGLYSKFRHPSYTGAWILFLGDALLFQSFIGLVILGVGMFIVYIQRIKIEEEMLLNEFGKEYKEYMKLTWKFLPKF